MRKIKEFDNILNECLERLLVKGETVEQCLSVYPEQAAELEPLLQTALMTSEIRTIQPRPDFRARARYQFRSELREAATRKGFRFFGWQPRWATAIAIVLALILAGSGTVVAAGNSMPSDFLYPTKLATEGVRLALTRSDIDKAQLYARFADKRVLEIARMAEKGKPMLVEQTARRLDTHLLMIVSLVSVQKLSPETMMAPPAPAQELAPAPVPARVPEQSRESDVPAPVRPNNKRARLRMAVARYAMQHPEALRATLNNVPESAKPALRRAIAISVKGYERALRAVRD